MIHKLKHPDAGKTVKVTIDIPEGGLKEYEFLVEDWWDRLAGKSWMFCDGNPACLGYAMRTGFKKERVPTDNEVVYGKIKQEESPFRLGYLVHQSEIRH